ncbi:MAG: tetratricopeptide repeat protein [Chloroflexi bacterium]|nr:tetratricopeptide repeat protein [Chloroflexota bacterium]
MTLQRGEDRTRLGRKLGQQAVALAAQGRWEEAVAANRAIVESLPDEVAAFNRLGRALIELGRFAEATEAYQKAVEVDPGNSIATKNIERLKAWTNAGQLAPEQERRLGKEFFASTAGKTGVVGLTNMSAPGGVEEIGAGGVVQLRREGQRVYVEDEEGHLLGELDPRHGARLAKLMQGGNEYSATVLTTSEGGTQVLVREEFQHPSQVGQMSFLPEQADRLYGQLERVSPVETPPIVDQARRPASTEGPGDGDAGESSSEGEDRGLLEGFTIVEKPHDREGSIE